MEVIVASTNKHKLAAVEEIFRDIYPNQDVQITGVKANSGVREQPVDHSEILEGVLNRLNHAKQLTEGNGDVYVSMENGILIFEFKGEIRCFDLAWVVIERRFGKRAFAHSTGIEFPLEYVEEAMNRGFATTTIGSVMAEKLGIDSTDPHSTLTDGLVSRSDMLKQTLRAALGQLNRLAY